MYGRIGSMGAAPGATFQTWSEFGNQILALTFLNRFNNFQISEPISPISACYTWIRRQAQALTPRQSNSRPP